MKNVCVIGIWHLGSVNAVGFAEKGFRVFGIEFDLTKAALLQAGKAPLYEPRLEELMRKHIVAGSLSFTADPSTVVREADFVIIAYDSPVNEQDEVDVGPVMNAARMLAPYLQSTTPVVITSQVPLGTSEQVEVLIHQRNPNWSSGVVYTPENLKLGVAIERFLTPDMLVLGTNSEGARAAVEELYETFGTKKIFMDLRSAEMVKHALNAFLATSISFINELANLADRLGADAVLVGSALKCDQRIGPKALLSPGLGFSGGTLPRDLMQLKKFAQELHYDAKLLDAVMAVNKQTFDQIVMKITQHLRGNLSGKTIGIMGLTYKPNTSTMRRSPAITLMQKFVEHGARCFGYDPMAAAEEMQGYQHLITRVQNLEELAQVSDVLLLVTEWPEFRNVDYALLAKSMRHPILVDSKNFLDPDVLTATGFLYEGFGRKGVASSPSL